jgi:hypothetical protein
MHFQWRSPEHVLSDHAGWLERIDGKNRRRGTSAPTLAASWSGPLDLLGALATHPDLTRVSLTDVTVEAKARFDEYRGNVRNHDLRVRGETVGGESVVICVEAKAGETLGDIVSEQEKAATKAGAGNPRSQASERLADLITTYCKFPREDPRVSELRYQLLTAWAGTIADSKGADHAVLALHEFLTDDRPDDRFEENGRELEVFGEVVLGSVLPAAESAWCVRVPDAPGTTARLYVAHLTTDLRTATLESHAK